MSPRSFYSKESIEAHCQGLSAEERLDFCSALVREQLLVSTERQQLCALSIQAAWAYVQSEQVSGRLEKAAAAKWMADLDAEGGETEAGERRIQHELRLGTRSRQKLANANAAIFRHWSIDVYDVLQDRPCIKTISVRLAEELACLAALISLEDARKEIHEAIMHRLRESDSSDEHMCVRDIETITARHRQSSSSSPQAQTQSIDHIIQRRPKHDLTYPPPKKRRRGNLSTSDLGRSSSGQALPERRCLLTLRLTLLITSVATMLSLVLILRALQMTTMEDPQASQICRKHNQALTSDPSIKRTLIASNSVTEPSGIPYH